MHPLPFPSPWIQRVCEVTCLVDHIFCLQGVWKCLDLSTRSKLELSHETKLFLTGLRSHFDELGRSHVVCGQSWHSEANVVRYQG